MGDNESPPRPPQVPSRTLDLGGHLGAHSAPGSPRTPQRRGLQQAGSPHTIGSAGAWQERCMELQLELHRTRSQATRVRDMLRDKLSELEQRVLEAEGRAEEAEDKVRVMEQRLCTWNNAESSQTLQHHQRSNGLGPAQHSAYQQQQLSAAQQQLPASAQQHQHQQQQQLSELRVGDSRAIESLETQVNEQKQLRLQDARQVEAKAARIKEWVTNKLRELEQQNQLLRDQNARCCHQLTLLRNHIATQGSRYSTVPARTSLSLEGSAGVADCSSPAAGVTRSLSHRRRSESLEPGALLCGGTGGATSATRSPQLERHRRNCSTGGVQKLLQVNAVDMSCGDALAQDLAEAVDSLALHNRPLLPPRQGSPAAVARTDSAADMMHDYAEIYTPSRDDKLPIWLCSSGTTIGGALGAPTSMADDAPGPSNGSSSTNSESLSEYVGGAKPPTPPLHRFPSWEAKIYQVAADGLKQWVGSVEGDGHGGNVSSGYCDISVPVYATVKGRASQIRSMPFTGDSSDDSSDGDEGAPPPHSTPNHGPPAMMHINMMPGAPGSHPSSDSSVSGSSPSKSAKTSASLSPAKRSSSGSPGKSKARDTSFESGLSDDYAIPPDALSCDATSTDASSMPSLLARASYADSPRRAESLEKIGHLTKLGGKLKTWRKRWFVLKNGALVYWKSQNDVNRKPQGQIALDESCRITRQDGASTFEINTGKKIYYLTADSIATMEEWVRVLQNVQRRNAARLLLSKEDQKPSVQGWLTKVKNGHAKKCWCSLMGKMFLYFKMPSDTVPLGQINMRDARVEEVEHVSDSDSEEREETGASQARLTVSIYPEHQGPTYLILPSKQERDNWLYHLTIVSGGGPNAGTQYEQLVQKLMETDGNPGCEIWRHPTLLHSKDNIVSPLTTLHSESLQAEAIKLFKCCQLFMSAAVEQAGIDYHVVLAQNALQVCLDSPELQTELVCALVKQTSRHLSHQGTTGVQVKPGKTLLGKPARQLLLCATQTLFTCDTHSYSSSSSAQNAQNAQAANNNSSPSSIQAPPLPPPADCKSNPPTYSFVQGWQLLALAVSLFVPRNSRLLWYLKLHLSRNAETKTECGKYAAYCERALERTIQNGGRDVKPSRMEVLSILLKNPYHHSLPHAIPVHMLNGAYQVVGFDGSTTIEEFLHTLNQEIACRDSAASGFTLFSDDPIEKDLEHFIDPQSKLCDVISKWETALREKGSGKFENSRVIQLTYKNRLYWRHAARMETDRERLLLCYQVNQQVVLGRFPLSRELALEMASLMAQIDLGEQTGERLRGSGGTSGTAVLHALDKFYPYRYRDTLTPEGLRDLQDLLAAKWAGLKGRNVLDCVRIYLTCARKWPFFGASMFQARPKFSDQSMAWLAVSEDSVTVLELASMAIVSRFSYSSVITFGGCQDDFMLVVGSEDGCGTEQKMLFAMSKPKVLEITLLIADYMNALGHTVPGTPQMNTLTRNGSRRSFRPLVVASTCNNTLSSHGQPDILKSTPDHQRIATEPKRRAHTDSNLV